MFFSRRNRKKKSGRHKNVISVKRFDFLFYVARYVNKYVIFA